METKIERGKIEIKRGRVKKRVCESKQWRVSSSRGPGNEDSCITHKRALF